MPETRSAIAPAALSSALSTRLAALALSAVALGGCAAGGEAEEADEVTASTAQAATATTTRFAYASFTAVEIDAKVLTEAGVVRPFTTGSRLVDPVGQLNASTAYNSRAAAFRPKALAMAAKLVRATCVDSAGQALTCFRTAHGGAFTAGGSAATYAARASARKSGAHPTASDVPIFRENATGKLWALSIHHHTKSTTQSATATFTANYATAAGNSLLGWHCQASGQNNDLTMSTDSYAFLPGGERASVGFGDFVGASGNACLDTGEWVENPATGEWETLGVTALRR